MSESKANLPPVICRVPYRSETFPSINGVSVAFRIDTIWSKPDRSDGRYESFFRVGGYVTQRGETRSAELKISWPDDARAAVENFWQRVTMRGFVRYTGPMEFSCDVTPSIKLVWSDLADGKSTASVVFADSGDEIRAEFTEDSFTKLRQTMLGFLP